MKAVYSFFIPVYKSLLEVPEYVTHFDSKSIGSFYRLIVSRVWRLDEQESLDAGYVAGPFRRLAKEYEDGRLVACLKDSEAAELIGVTPKYIRQLRNYLLDLELIKASKEEYHSDVYFYQVGEVIDVEMYGKYHEKFYIDRWLKDCDDAKKSKTTPKFALKLAELLDRSRKDAIQMVCYEVGPDSEVDSGFELKKNFMDESGTTVSTIRNSSSTSVEEKEAEKPVQDKSLPKAPINNKNKVTIKKRTPQMQSLFSNEEVDESVRLEELLNPALSPSKFISAIRKAVKSFGQGEVVAHLIGNLKSADKRSIRSSSTPLTMAFEAWCEEYDWSSSSVITLIWGWWSMLSLDLNKPFLVHAPRKVRAIISRLPEVTDWKDFMYFVSKKRERYGSNAFQYDDISWLHRDVAKFSSRIKEYKATSKLNLSKKEIDSVVSKVLRDIQEQNEKDLARLKEIAEDNGVGDFDEDEDILDATKFMFED